MNKTSLIFFVFAILITAHSCQAQKKMMQTIEDANILVENKTDFIDRPLSTLLAQIKPKIVMVFGDPNGGVLGTYLTFYFVDKKQYAKIKSEGRQPVVIFVQFYPEENAKRKPIPQEGITDWGEKDIKAYGDMKVARFRLVGGKF